MKIAVDVTEDDISLSVPGEENACAIHRALFRKKCDEWTHIKVSLFRIKWRDRESGNTYQVATPRPAQEFIAKFDKGDEVEPFRFMLDLSSPLLVRKPSTGVRSAAVKAQELDYRLKRAQEPEDVKEARAKIRDANKRVKRGT